jgi:hypothetical protein
MCVSKALPLGGGHSPWSNTMSSSSSFTFGKETFRLTTRKQLVQPKGPWRGGRGCFERGYTKLPDGTEHDESAAHLLERIEKDARRQEVRASLDASCGRLRTDDLRACHRARCSAHRPAVKRFERRLLPWMQRTREGHGENRQTLVPMRVPPAGRRGARGHLRRDPLEQRRAPRLGRPSSGAHRWRRRLHHQRSLRQHHPLRRRGVARCLQLWVA